ncbi:MAG: flagellin lysine-N-methylase [Lachnospiraceae bacterium]|nr:flagellin lysine-N-methylase [Lachnospiraceae bacterium]
MRFTFPDYYPGFQCLAGSCPATCCEDWQIVIDPASLRRYKSTKGPFGRKLRRRIDWKDGVFRQKGRRCVFLNEENLCEMHIEAGAGMMCRTCRMHPRHVEVYDQEREIMLALSCPAAARLILGTDKKAEFVSFEDEREEEENEDFDFFLFSALQDTRQQMIVMLQDRRESISLRLARVLALAHDVQKRIEDEQIFEIGDTLEIHADPVHAERIGEKIRSMAEGAPEKCRESHLVFRKALLDKLARMEVLEEAWSADLARWRQMSRETVNAGTETAERRSEADRGLDFAALMHGLARSMAEEETCRAQSCQNEGEEEVCRAPRGCQSAAKNELAGMTGQARAGAEKAHHGAGDGSRFEVMQEQLAVYLLQTYFCSAVYDQRAYAKVKMAVLFVLFWREIARLEELEADEERLMELAYRLSRELEHSDVNLSRLQR